MRGMNEIGLVGLELFGTGVILLVVGVASAGLGVFLLGLPFAGLGAVGLIDDLFLNEKIIKWVLRIR